MGLPSTQRGSDDCGGAGDGGRHRVGGTADRRLFALDADAGSLLWETRLNGDISGAPVTFEVAGRQSLAVGAGGRIGQTTSYARLTGTSIPDGAGVMWVFALPDASAGR